MKTNTSEVARLRRLIEAECSALQLMTHAPAIVASHAIIDSRFRVLDTYVKQLGEHVGQQEATKITTSIYREVIG